MFVGSFFSSASSWRAGADKNQGSGVRRIFAILSHHFVCVDAENDSIDRLKHSDDSHWAT